VNEQPKHEDYISAILEQSVRREGAITRKQRPVRRFIENRILGDARKRGETHQWMYDRISLGELLTNARFCSPTVRECNASTIPDWATYGLETADDGAEYKVGSLYMEATK
jgi:hypothetical protein